MVTASMNRRGLLGGIGAFAMVPSLARAEDYIDLNWSDLIPIGQPAIPPVIQSEIDHTQAAPMSRQPESSEVRTDWNGKIVRLPGYILPMDYSGTGVTAFLLVPFVGACVHVPAPPANQLVFVTTSEPYESAGLYEAVNVIGMFGVSSLSTHLADVGYALSADRIEPFKS